MENQSHMQSCLSKHPLSNRYGFLKWLSKCGSPGQQHQHYLETQKCKFLQPLPTSAETLWVGFNKTSRWSWCRLKFENTWFKKINSEKPRNLEYHHQKTFFVSFLEIESKPNPILQVTIQEKNRQILLCVRENIINVVAVHAKDYLTKKSGQVCWGT